MERGTEQQETRRAEQRRLADAILRSALDAVDPFKAVCAALHLSGSLLTAGDRQYDLSSFRRIFVVGAGKAGAPMAQAVESILDGRISGGYVNVRYGCSLPTSTVQIREAGHPVPDEQGLEGTRQIVETVRQADENDLVICLISGGGSALLTLPDDNISLADNQAVTQAMLSCGATINEINTVRKHLSQVKGGHLAQVVYPATVISFILSDVVGNPLDIIASGPTVPDSSTFDDAWDIVRKYDLEGRLPQPVLAILQAGLRGEIPETPKPGDPVFDKVQNLIVASNYVAAIAAEKKAAELGFRTLLLSTYVEGEAREVAKVLGGIAREIADTGRPLPRPACIICGGETTVTIRGEGRGGRNTELALSAAVAIQGTRDVMVFSAATDGSDGPTDASGAYAYGDTVTRGRNLGLNVLEYLHNNDSYNFFARLGDLAKSGPTNTNVNDLVFVFAF
jgi:glycerate 2-kinase